MVTGLPRQPDRFMGRYSQSLLPLRGEDDSNKAVPGQKNQIEWRPELIQIGVINFRFGSKPVLRRHRRVGPLLEVKPTKSGNKRTLPHEGRLSGQQRTSGGTPLHNRF